MYGKKWFSTRLLSLLLTAAMLCALLLGYTAESTEIQFVGEHATAVADTWYGEAAPSVQVDAYVPQQRATQNYGGTQEEAVAELRQKMTERESPIKVSLTIDNTQKDWGKLLLDEAWAHTGNPIEGDYLRWQCGASIPYSTRIFQIGKQYYAEITYTLQYDTTKEQEQELSNKIQSVLDELDLYDATEYEKIRGIYDYICSNVTYDYEHLSDWSYRLMFTAYAAMVNGTSVCQGYALLFYRMALTLGVDTRLIGGEAGEPHAWNIARIGSVYYNLDSTWDATELEYFGEYNYFLKGKNTFFTSHMPWMEFDSDAFYAAYPVSDTDYVYEPVAGSDQCGDNVVWNLNNGVLTISGTGEMYNYASATQTPWYASRKQIHTIVVEAGVTSIGSFSFDGCTALKIVRLPDSLKKVGNAAFAGCTALWHVLYAGTETQWAAVTINTRNEDLKNAIRHGNSTGNESLDTENKICAICIANCSHQWNAGTVLQETTCLEDGLAEYTCKLCGKTETRVVAAEGHRWVEANCTRPKTCRRCSATEGVASGHNWQTATCTAPETCLVCGTSRGEALGHSWTGGNCTEPQICKTCGYEDTVKGHDWKNATCTQPKTCRTCGTTSGSAKGHDWNVATCTAAKTCKICGVTDGAAMGHDWQAATCTEPKTCKTCGATEGATLGHDWQAATCTEAKTCKTCGATEGAALGHDWQTATCTEAKTCKTCGATEGAALGHDWQTATCTEPKTCKTCGATEGAAMGHDWQAATCTEAKTCKTCGATEGTAMGHAWQAATCTEPKTCKTCGATEGAALGHDWQAATCTEAKTCKTCGATEGAALGHAWQVATCTEPKTCKTCGATEGAALGHSWNNATCVTAKTCVVCKAEEGTHLGHDWKEAGCTTPKTCPRCGAVDGAPLGHDWSAATCTLPETCAICGQTNGQAKGHSWNEATCTEPRTCGVCSAAEGMALGHDWQAATCTQPKTCTRCATTEGDELAHDYGMWVDAGNQHKKVCNRCGDALTEDHAWDQGIVTKEPGEYVDGEICYTCTVCAAEKRQILPSLGHIHNYTPVTTAPTCLEAGFITYTCGCGDRHIENGAAALGHDYLAQQTEPTCTEEGFTTYTCSRCADQYVGDKVGALEHAYDSIVIDPTCQTEGYSSHICTRCGHSYTDAHTEKLEHTLEVLAGYAPTCTENGMTDGSICVACGETMVAQTTITMLGHRFGQWEIEKEATAEAPGEKVRVCVTCGETERELIPATGPAPTQPTEPTPPQTEPTEPTLPTEPETEPTQPAPSQTEAEDPTVPTAPSVAPSTGAVETPAATMPNTTQSSVDDQEHNAQSNIVIVVLAALGVAVIAGAMVVIRKRK